MAEAVAENVTSDTTTADAAALAAGSQTQTEMAAADAAAIKTADKPAATPDATAEPGKADAQAKPPENYALTLPAQTVFEPSDLEGFSAEAKALGLSQDQAQALVTTRVATVNAMADQFYDEAKADPEIGGAKFDATVALAKSGRDALFPPGSEEAALVRQLLDKTGLGNHKALIRAFARIGKLNLEDTHVSGQTQAPAQPKRTADVLFPTTAKT